jgi:hypothetical protein
MLRLTAQGFEEYRLIMESIDQPEQSEATALLLNFLNISGSGVQDEQDWEDSPPSALAILS